MNAAELIKEWPGWSKANAESVFNSPAWRIVLEYDGEEARVSKGGEIAPLVSLKVEFDENENTLVIGEWERCADLMALKGRMDGLPDEVVIALVEKECGSLLQTIENTIGRQLRIAGLAKESADGLTGFTLTGAWGSVGFALRTDAAMIQRFGELKNLDAGHSSIRAMEREAIAEYAEVSMLDSELSALSVGDMILIPEDAVKAWRTGGATDDLLHVRSEKPALISFAQFADDQLPEVPEAQQFVLIRRGRVLARAELASLGAARAVRIVSLG